MSIFMSYEGITQDNASDKSHDKWIPIIEFAWGSSRQITSATSTRGDRESTNARISDLIVYKWMDQSTSKLFLDACCGSGRNVIIHLTKTGTGSGADLYMEYKLKNALINGYEVSGGTLLFRGRPQEIITISFVEIECRYTPYGENNEPLSPISVAFNTATNTRR